MTTESSAVLLMDADSFHTILSNDGLKKTYQIIDVREPDEIATISLPFEGVEYIPMSKSSEWEGEIKAGKLLDASKPTAVMCRSGVRSMRMAQFLVNEAKFAQVYSVSGGITEYATKFDTSSGLEYSSPANLPQWHKSCL